MRFLRKLFRCNCSDCFSLGGQALAGHYRHNALSSIPQGISPAQAQLEAAKIRAKTAQARIESEERISSRKAETRERKAADSQSRFRTDRNGRRIFGGIQAFGFNDIGFGGPIGGVTPTRSRGGRAAPGGRSSGGSRR